MKTKQITIFLALLMYVGVSAFAQTRNCGSMDYLEYQELTDPKRTAKMDAIEAQTNAFIASEAAVAGVITIPVVVHVIYNNSTENISDAQILSQITVLNDDFRRTNSDANGTWSQAADTEIEFCMASSDPNGNSTNGITRTSTSVSSFALNDNMKFNSSGGKDAWPAGDYLNIWVCDISSGYLGYAQFPGGSPSTDGVVIDYAYFGTIGTATSPFDLGRTATHEVGHWLNLRHIWGDGGCGVDDFVSDTPLSDAANYGCATGHSSCGSTDMVQNYMDYSDDDCMNLFTAGQTTRMRALFDVGGARASLLASNGCGGGTAPTCSDGIQNGSETGVDCGGPDCAPCSSGCSDNAVTLTIVLDNYPEETSWTVKNSGGTTVASGGTYGSQPDGSTVVEELCLPDGCYDLTMNDSYGDGICCSYGIGNYTLVEDGSGTTLASGGSFGSSETTNFCVGGTAPTCTDGIQNGSETGVDCGGPDCAPCPPDPTCTDGIQNGSETGVDCGGPDCPACPTCSDGIQNGNETGVDCGGPDCPACSGGGCSYVTIDNHNFESGWGIWNDGGSDCRRSNKDAAYANGTYCVRLRDNTSTSVMTTDALNLSSYDELTVDFSYYARSMENGEDFWLQASTDGGSTYQTLITWARGVDFNNNTRYNQTVIITGTFGSNFKLRFRNDASGNSDWVYIDDVNFTGCLNGARLEEEITAEDEMLHVSDQHSVSMDIVKLYPNPASDYLKVSYDLEEDAELEIMITDVTGRVMQSRTENGLAGLNVIRMETNDLVPGLYVLHIVNKADMVSRKFIINR